MRPQVKGPSRALRGVSPLVVRGLKPPRPQKREISPLSPEQACHSKSQTNGSEFCGACFDPDGNTLYVNQQGD